MNELWRLIGNNKRKHERLGEKLEELEEYEENEFNEVRREELEEELDELDKELESLENWQNVIEKLSDLVGAFTHLEDAFEMVDEDQLDKYIGKGYPFSKDFLTTSHDVYMWALDSIKKISEQK